MQPPLVSNILFNDKTLLYQLHNFNTLRFAALPYTARLKMPSQKINTLHRVEVASHVVSVREVRALNVLNVTVRWDGNKAIPAFNVEYGGGAAPLTVVVGAVCSRSQCCWPQSRGCT